MASKVEILLATYNGEKYLREQLDSLLGQTYKDIAILVRDDGSTDGTVQIIRDYEKLHPHIVKLVHDESEDSGPSSNFMRLTRFAEADYVMFCDQDDVWLPEKVELSLRYMLAEEVRIGSNCPILVYGSYQAVDQDLNPIDSNERANQIAQHSTSLNTLLVQNCVTGCLAMLNKPLYSMLGGYDPRILMHDWWAALCASAAGSIVHFPETVMLYRQHGGNSVGAVNVRSPKYVLSKVFDPKTKDAKYEYLRQATLLKERCGSSLEDEKRATLDQFIRLYEHPSKLKRMRCLVRGGYMKGNLARRLGQLWYA